MLDISSEASTNLGAIGPISDLHRMAGRPKHGQPTKVYSLALMCSSWKSSEKYEPSLLLSSLVVCSLLDVIEQTLPQGHSLGKYHCCKGSTQDVVQMRVGVGLISMTGAGEALHL